MGLEMNLHLEQTPISEVLLGKAQHASKKILAWDKQTDASLDDIRAERDFLNGLRYVFVPQVVAPRVRNVALNWEFIAPGMPRDEVLFAAYSNAIESVESKLRACVLDAKFGCTRAKEVFVDMHYGYPSAYGRVPLA